MWLSQEMFVLPTPLLKHVLTLYIIALFQETTSMTQDIKKSDQGEGRLYQNPENRACSPHITLITKAIMLFGSKLHFKP